MIYVHFIGMVIAAAMLLWVGPPSPEAVPGVSPKMVAITFVFLVILWPIPIAAYLYGIVLKMRR